MRFCFLWHCSIVTISSSNSLDDTKAAALVVEKPGEGHCTLIPNVVLLEAEV